MTGKVSTKVIQISNIAPQATKDQLQSIFGPLGKVEDLRLYPMVRDVTVQVTSRICYVRYADPASVLSAMHLTNCAFIDRALICTPLVSGVIPEEHRALEMAANGTLVPGQYTAEPTLPADVITRVEGQIPNQVLATFDPKLDKENLPQYPPLPVNFTTRKLVETRHTIVVLNYKSDWGADELIDFFEHNVGPVKYTSFATYDKDSKKLAMIEFEHQKSVVDALKLQGTKFRSSLLDLGHSTQPINKPEMKTNEVAQKEIEKALASSNDGHNQISAIVDPSFRLMAAHDGRTVNRRSRTRSRSREIRSRSRTSRTKRSRSRKRRSHSRSNRKRSGSRRKSRSRSRSRSNKRRKRSTSRRRKSRSRSKERKHRRRERSRSRHKRRSRSRDRRSKSRDRSRSRHRSERKKKSHREKKELERKYSPSRSRSKSTAKKSPAREKASSSRRSAERKLKKISEERVRDYDAEEKIGLDDNGCEKSSSKSDNMDISP